MVKTVLPFVLKADMQVFRDGMLGPAGHCRSRTKQGSAILPEIDRFYKEVASVWPCGGDPGRRISSSYYLINPQDFSIVRLLILLPLCTKDFLESLNRNGDRHGRREATVMLSHFYIVNNAMEQVSLGISAFLWIKYPTTSWQ